MLRLDVPDVQVQVRGVHIAREDDGLALVQDPDLREPPLYTAELDQALEAAETSLAQDSDAEIAENE